MKIGIIGLGLIGGSMAQALHKKTDHEIFAADIDEKMQGQALYEGVVDAVLDEATLPLCDVLMLALYPQAAIDYMKVSAGLLKSGAYVVDFCGVKRVVSEALIPLSTDNDFHFVGGHPMAGREKSGYSAAIAELFNGASMILTPHSLTPKKVLNDLEELFTTIGFGSIRVTDDETHDRMIAYTSQLAHVLSNAYVKSPLALEHKGFSAGSFQDLTRVATLNAKMWTELFLDNRDFLIGEIDALCGRLSEYSEALKEQNPEKLFFLLQEGSEQKAKTLNGV